MSCSSKSITVPKAGAVAFSDDGSSTRSLKALYNAARLVADLEAALEAEGYERDPVVLEALRQRLAGG